MSDKKKYSRTVVGSVLKSKDASKPDYIKVKDNVSLKAGQVLRLESKKFKLSSLDEAVKAGRMSEELAAKRREAIEKNHPEFVRFDIILVTQSE